MIQPRPTRPLPVVAHRGNPWDFPENTLASFESAVTLGAPAIELDVRLTRDGALVVFHDDTVDRTTDGAGAVAERTLADLRRLSAGYPERFGAAFAGERIPTLREVLDFVGGRARVLVELKGDEQREGDDSLERLTLETLQDAGMSGDALLLAFDHRRLAVCRDLDPQIPRGLLADRLVGEVPLETARAAGCAVVVPEKGMVSPELIAAAAAVGLAVGTWLVDDPSELEGLEALGLAGVGSNRPGALLAHRADRALRS